MVYAISDLHLSLGGDHSMEVFPGWAGYVQKIEQNWRDVVKEGDTVVLPGDISWGMSLAQALADFRFLDALPGQKVLLKGNHDYWWTTRTKMEGFFHENGLNTLQILHNNSIAVENIAICGSRGWIFETGEPFDEKIINREVIRLELSITEAVKSKKTPVLFLHYPPVYGENKFAQVLELMHRYEIKDCYYGHIHAAGCRWAIDGMYETVRFHLVSSDYMRFRPLRVENSPKFSD